MSFLTAKGEIFRVKNEIVLKVLHSGASLQEGISSEAASEHTLGNTGFGRFESGNGLDRLRSTFCCVYNSGEVSFSFYFLFVWFFVCLFLIRGFSV